MKSSLTQNKSDDLSVTIEKQFEHSLLLRERLVEMLEKDIDSINKSMRTEDLDSPNWEVKHAMKLGEIKGVLRMINLIK